MSAIVELAHLTFPNPTWPHHHPTLISNISMNTIGTAEKADIQSTLHLYTVEATEKIIQLILDTLMK